MQSFLKNRHELRSEPGAPLDLAIVGVTGAVGAALLEVIEERGLPVRRLRALASERSAGGSVQFRGRVERVERAGPDAFEGADVVLFAATGSLSQTLAPEAVRRGATVVDKSSTWRMEPAVPLVVPEVNAQALDAHCGLIANPNCTTTGVVMALEPLRRVAGLRRVVVTTFQAVSGAGQAGSDELSSQLRATAQGAAPVARVFAAPIAHNVVPLCETLEADGYTSEERKLLHETRKILGLPELPVSMTCTRVPVPVGHAASLLVETETPLAPEAAREALAKFDGVEVVDGIDPVRFPTPRDVAGRDEILVGRVRRDLSSDALWLWQVGDNLRKGAATNAVQIVEALRARRRL
jgi:aspartate-semialdehyde dehydrogenase